MSEYLADLKQRVCDLQDERDWLQSKLDSFFTGDVPNGASFDHMILAKYGRIRLIEKSKQPALLVKNTSI